METSILTYYYNFDINKIKYCRYLELTLKIKITTEDIFFCYKSVGSVQSFKKHTRNIFLCLFF